MHKVVSILKAIISPDHPNITDPHIDPSIDNANEKGSTSLKTSTSNIDINMDLSIESDIIITNNNEKESSQNQISVMVPENNLSRSVSIQTNLSKDSLESAFNDINNIIVEKLITFMTKKHNESITFDLIKQLLEQQMLRFNQPLNNILDWLLKNQVKPSYIYFLGVIYYYDIGNIGENSSKAFELFSQASKDNYSIAQVYLGKCYNDGYGVERNKNLAFNWYQKSVESGSIIGKLNAKF